MGIDSATSRFAETTAKRKRAANHGITGEQCLKLNFLRCRERDCPHDCHSKAVPRLKPRPVEDVA